MARSRGSGLVARSGGQVWWLGLVARSGGQVWWLGLVASYGGQVWGPGLVARDKLRETTKTIGENIKKLKIQPPYGGLLSRSCGGLQPFAGTEVPFGPMGHFARRSEKQKNGQRA